MKRRLFHRGFTSIALINPQKPVNFGGCLRSLGCFGGDLIYLVGARYQKQASDTLHTTRHIPTIHVPDADKLLEVLPQHAIPIAVEFDATATPLHQFSHPESAVYLFGPENGSLSPALRAKCHASLFIPTLYCLNLCMAVTLVLYDRFMRTIPSPKDVS